MENKTADGSLALMPTFGEQDENGIDLSLLRANLRLTPMERIEQHRRALMSIREVQHAGRAAGLIRHSRRT